MCAEGLDVRRSSQARIEDNGGCGTLVALRRTAAQSPKIPSSGVPSRRACEG
jgi:hypothetical protein